MYDLTGDRNKYLFISDAHLGGFSEEKNKEIEDNLIRLIEYCLGQKIRIAILGDLFDYWMEYPDATPQIGEKVLDSFEHYNHHMGRTIYITGNHDNWTRSHFKERGFEVIGEQKTFTLDENKVMLLHGDGLRHDRFNLSRPPMHRLLRNPDFIRVYQYLFSPKTGITIMKYFSRFKRAITQNHDNQEKLNKWAENELKTTGTDIIICGHDHIPRMKTFNFGTFINLGTFCHDRTVALYNNNTISIVTWDDENGEFKPFRD